VSKPKPLPLGKSSGTTETPYGLIGLDAYGRVRNTTEMWFATKQARRQFVRNYVSSDAYENYAYMELQPCGSDE
jgi:hypothetical protein